MKISKFRKVLKQFTLPILFLCACPIFADDDGKDKVQIIATGTRATPIKHEPPIYPIKALRAEIEGWVVLNFIIKEDGTTDNIVVLHTSIENYFEEAAIKAVSAWTYEPATRNREPVIQYNKNSRHTFRITGLGEGVTSSFRFDYKNALKAIQEGDLEKTESLIAKLSSSKKRLLSEVCYLDILKASYFRTKGNNKASLVHLKRALVIADEETTNAMYIALLRQAIAESTKEHDYRAALRYFSTLLEVDSDLAADDPVHKLAERIKQTIDSDGALFTQGKLSQCDHCGSRIPRWYHALNRNRFTIDQVEGKVDEVEVLCGNHSVSLGYDLDVVWDAHKDWGECDVLVSGDAGTAFRLIELPRAK